MTSIKKDKTLAFLILSAIATRVYPLFVSKCYLHPDNIFQLLEPAHKIIFGYGITPWEYVYGMRSWLQPLMIAIVFKVGTILNVNEITHLIFINKALMVLFSLALLYVIWEATLTWYDRKTAVYAVFFSVFSYLLWLWSADTNPHVPSTLYITVALLMFWRGWQNSSHRHYLISGLSLGVAFMFRFDAILFLIPIALFTVSYRRFRAVEAFVGGLVVVLVLQGMLDYFTWGSLMHSPLSFVTQNIVEGKSSVFGSAPAYYYIGVLGLHLTALFLIPYSIEKKPVFYFISLNILVFLLIYSLVSHKEARFIIPIMPLFSILAGKGMGKIEKFHGKVAIYCIAVLTVCLSAPLVYMGFLDYNGLDAVSYVGRLNDSRGVAYSISWFDTGGYTYLHKKIPFVKIGEKVLDPLLDEVNCAKPDMNHIGFQCAPLETIIGEEEINYVIVDDKDMGLLLSTNGYMKVTEFGDTIIYKRI